MIEFLGNSFLFCFGYLPNIFNFVFPETLHLLTNRFTKYDYSNPKEYWIIVIPSMLLPFGWLALSIILIISRKLISISEELVKEVVKNIRI